MNYYEELGLSPSATTEEIRHAYRTVARLLHPDHIHDPSLKPAAELLMRRLNAVCAVLLDPERRLGYDQSLITEISPPQPPKTWIKWMAPAAVSAVGLVVMIFDAPPAMRRTLPAP